MWLRAIFIFLLLCEFICCRRQFCTREAAIRSFKRPSYEFSRRLLDRVAQETDYHFIFSPLSTWIQLTTLAEGARGHTLKEISKLTRHNMLLCNRRRLKEALSEINNDFNWNSGRSSYVIIDKVFDVKEKFKTEAEIGNATKVLLLDFSKPKDSAAIANDIISLGSNGLIKEVIDPEDFEETTLLLADTAFFKSDWKYPFNPSYTEKSPFYDEENLVSGEVNLMSQIGYFNLTTIPYLDVQVLELSCDKNDRISMLIFLPTADNTITELFSSLEDILLSTIFYKFRDEGTKLVNVMLPRFKITTEIDSLPELIYDMGITKIFYPDKANFDGISDYKLYASMMTQIADIEVTEQGFKLEMAEFLVSGSKMKEFKANKPFGFILVDKENEVILYAGIYSNPSVF